MKHVLALSLDPERVRSPSVLVASRGERSHSSRATHRLDTSPARQSTCSRVASTTTTTGTSLVTKPPCSCRRVASPRAGAASTPQPLSPLGVGHRRQIGGRWLRRSVLSSWLGETLASKRSPTRVDCATCSMTPAMGGPPSRRPPPSSLCWVHDVHERARSDPWRFSASISVTTRHSTASCAFHPAPRACERVASRCRGTWTRAGRHRTIRGLWRDTAPRRCQSVDRVPRRVLRRDGRAEWWFGQPRGARRRSARPSQGTAYRHAGLGRHRGRARRAARSLHDGLSTIK